MYKAGSSRSTSSQESEHTPRVPLRTAYEEEPREPDQSGCRKSTPAVQIGPFRAWEANSMKAWFKTEAKIRTPARS